MKKPHSPLSLEVLAESEVRRMYTKGKTYLPLKLRKGLDIEEGGHYVSYLVKLNSDECEYNGVRAILLLPVQVSYTPKCSK